MIPAPLNRDSASGFPVFHLCVRLKTVTVLGMLMVGAVGCSGAGNWQDPASRAETTRSPQPVYKRAPASPENSPRIYSRQDLHQPLMAFYRQWEGVPYRFGGQTQSGIDCSAFVQQSVRAVTGVQLPRTTRQQSRQGYAVEVTQAQVGDVVFFKTGRALNHVGVYLGGKKFMHASESRGVAISRLDDSYWASRMTQIRRLNLP